MELAKQEVKRQENETVELMGKLTTIEEENKLYKEKESKGVEQELRSSLAVLEEQISDKNKVNYKLFPIHFAVEYRYLFFL